MSKQYRKEVTAAWEDTRWTFRYLWWRVLGVVLAVTAIGWFLAAVTRPVQVVDRVTNPDRIIQNYEWFEETHNDAKALDQQIVNADLQLDSLVSTLDEDRANWSRVDQQEFNRLNAVVLGLRNQRATVVADYNARSNQITRNLWKGSGLPYQLEIVEDKTKEIWE